MPISARSVNVKPALADLVLLEMQGHKFPSQNRFFFFPKVGDTHILECHCLLCVTRLCVKAAKETKYRN